ncbi:MAG: hypothetical protein HKN04_12250 [Rhodothermaceae bacterium]|nr:hypothetical protein [Rhodothermaceae bacterium]
MWTTPEQLPWGFGAFALTSFSRMEGERADQCGRILDAFAQSYQFARSANTEFAQCSPATLVPPSE